MDSLDFAAVEAADNLLDEAAYATGTAVATHKGFPNPAAERGRTPLSLDRLLVRSPASTYFFRVRGHHWRRLGIYDGDIAIIDRARTPIPGKIVVAITPTGELVLQEWGKTGLETLWGVVTTTIHEL